MNILYRTTKTILVNPTKLDGMAPYDIYINNCSKSYNIQIPVKQLLYKYNDVNCNNDPIVEGTAPKILFNYQYSNITNYVPWKLLNDKSKYANFVRDPIAAGITPNMSNQN